MLAYASYQLLIGQGCGDHRLRLDELFIDSKPKLVSTSQAVCAQYLESIHSSSHEGYHLGHAIRKVTHELSELSSSATIAADLKDLKSSACRIINGDGGEKNSGFHVASLRTFAKWDVDYFRKMSRREWTILVLGLLRAQVLENTFGVGIAGFLVRSDKSATPLGNNLDPRLFDGAFSGVSGYCRFCDLFTEGRMQKGYYLMSALCKVADKSFKLLKWPKQFHGSTTEFRELAVSIEKNWDKLVSAPCEVDARISEINITPCTSRLKATLSITERRVSSL